MRRLIVLACLWLQQASADDFFQRSFILSELKKSALLSKNFDLPFVTQLEVRKEAANFSSNSGLIAFSTPKTASSAYDKTISYDLTNFYTSENHRARFVVNQFLPGTDLLISAGYDSGSSTQKIAISKTWFMGLAGYKKFNDHFYFYFSSGSWQQQHVTESPCLDEYGREYWCPTLIAWSDRPVTTFKPGRFLDLKFEYIF